MNFILVFISGNNKCKISKTCFHIWNCCLFLRSSEEQIISFLFPFLRMPLLYELSLLLGCLLLNTENTRLDNFLSWYKSPYRQQEASTWLGARFSALAGPRCCLNAISFRHQILQMVQNSLSICLKFSDCFHQICLNPVCGYTWLYICRHFRIGIKK